MKFKKLLLTFVFLIGSLIGLSSCSKEVLTVYTEVGFAPFEYVSNGEISGVDIDIMNMVGEKLGKKVVFENVAFDTIIDTVSEGKLTNVGAAGLSVTEERLKKVNFSKEYYQANLYVIYNKNNISSSFSKTMSDGNEGVYWGSLASTKGIGVQTGTTADLFIGDELVEGGSLYGTSKSDYDSLDVAIMDIGINIDYVIIDELPAKKLVENQPQLSCLPLYYPGDNGGEDEVAYDVYAIAVTKGEDELLNAINEVLDELLIEDASGVTGVEKLVNKHLGFKEETDKLDANVFVDIWVILTTPELNKYLFQGFGNTLIISLLAAILGLVLGVVIAIVKVFSIDNKYLKIPGIICDIYTTIIRGTPVALQLFIMVFAILAIPGFKETAVVLTFALNSSAYVSENIRAGIMSVDKGQMEAGRALGLSKLTTMLKIIFPQAIKNVIPSIGNELIALVKETSIVALVGSTVGTLTFDLNQATQTINKTIANYLAPAILAGILYLIIVYGITLLIKLFERRFAASDKR